MWEKIFRCHMKKPAAWQLQLVAQPAFLWKVSNVKAAHFPYSGYSCLGKGPDLNPWFPFKVYITYLVAILGCGKPTHKKKGGEQVECRKVTGSVSCRHDPVISCLRSLA